MKCKYAPFLSYLELHKSFVVVGNIKGSYCPGKEIQVECLERVILETLPCFQKSFKKYLRWIANL